MDVREIANETKCRDMSDASNNLQRLRKAKSHVIAGWNDTVKHHTEVHHAEAREAFLRWRSTGSQRAT